MCNFQIIHFYRLYVSPLSDETDFLQKQFIITRN